MPVKTSTSGQLVRSIQTLSHDSKAAMLESRMTWLDVDQRTTTSFGQNNRPMTVHATRGYVYSTPNKTAKYLATPQMIAYVHTEYKHTEVENTECSGTRDTICVFSSPIALGMPLDCSSQNYGGAGRMQRKKEKGTKNNAETFSEVKKIDQIQTRRIIAAPCSRNPGSPPHPLPSPLRRRR